MVRRPEWVPAERRGCGGSWHAQLLEGAFLVAFLSPFYLHGVDSRVGSERTALWALVSTYLPGRSGAECRERWMQLCDGTASAMVAPAPAQTSTAALQVRFGIILALFPLNND